MPNYEDLTQTQQDRPTVLTVNRTLTDALARLRALETEIREAMSYGTVTYKEGMSLIIQVEKAIASIAVSDARISKGADPVYAARKAIIDKAGAGDLMADQYDDPTSPYLYNPELAERLRSIR
jgi:hypothetical protein